MWPLTRGVRGGAVRRIGGRLGGGRNGGKLQMAEF